MPRPDLTAAMETESLGAQISPIFIVDFETSGGTSRWWTGYGDLVWDGDTFVGVGDLTEISPSEETTEISASGISISLSGIPSANISLALNSIEQGRPSNVWLGALDSDGALIVDPVLLFSGLTDVPIIEEDGETSKITCTIESLEVDRQRSRVRWYSSEDQNRIDPGDLGFEYVPSLQDAKIVWTDPS